MELVSRTSTKNNMAAHPLRRGVLKDPDGTVTSSAISNYGNGCLLFL
jgi:hypothetical protein